MNRLGVSVDREREGTGIECSAFLPVGIEGKKDGGNQEGRQRRTTQKSRRQTGKEEKTLKEEVRSVNSVSFLWEVRLGRCRSADHTASTFDPSVSFMPLQ